MRPEKFVVLEYLKGESKGVRFFCFNRPDNTHTADGDLYYKEVGFTDDVKQAQALCPRHHQSRRLHSEFGQASNGRQLGFRADWREVYPANVESITQSSPLHRTCLA